jgi:hypothetical protein
MLLNEIDRNLALADAMSVAHNVVFNLMLAAVTQIAISIMLQAKALV